MSTDRNRDAILAKLLTLFQESAVPQQGGEADVPGEAEPIDDKKPKLEPKPPEVVKKGKISQEELERAIRGLVEMLNRTHRENGHPCCQNMLAPSVSGISVQRKLKNGRFETPANGLFDAADTVKFSCRIMACPNMDVRIDMAERDADSADRIVSDDNLGRGGDLNPDPRFPNDPGTHSYGKEVDLSGTSFSIGQSPAQIVLSISVRDSCKRVAVGRMVLTFVDLA